MLSLLLISLLILVIATISLLLVLNQMIYAYENEKLEALTNQIKQKNGLNILSKTSAKRTFSTFDLNKSIKKSKQLVGTILKDATDQLQKIKSNDKSEELENSVSIKNSFKNVGGVAKNAFTSLSSLIKPIKSDKKYEELDLEEKREETYKEDVQILVEKTDENKNETEQATINMVVDKTHTDYKTFSRLEQKILKRLQEDGMKNYDIWLDLGKLYLKYDQSEKAKEVFALVLKHAPQDSKIKEIARNELIGLG